MDRYFPGQATYAFLPPKDRLYGSNKEPPQSASNGKYALMKDLIKFQHDMLQMHHKQLMWLRRICIRFLQTVK